MINPQEQLFAEGMWVEWCVFTRLESAPPTDATAPHRAARLSQEIHNSSTALRAPDRAAPYHTPLFTLLQSSDFFLSRSELSCLLCSCFEVRAIKVTERHAKLRHRDRNSSSLIESDPR